MSAHWPVNSVTGRVIALFRSSAGAGYASIRACQDQSGHEVGRSIAPLCPGRRCAPCSDQGFAWTRGSMRDVSLDCASVRECPLSVRPAPARANRSDRERVSTGQTALSAPKRRVLARVPLAPRRSVQRSSTRARSWLLQPWSQTLSVSVSATATAARASSSAWPNSPALLRRSASTAETSVRSAGAEPSARAFCSRGSASSKRPRWHKSRASIDLHEAITPSLPGGAPPTSLAVCRHARSRSSSICAITERYSSPANESPLTSRR